eukprot:m.151997 g.151997  ORF g.151997 m.151997 type:complete len:465 (+) comp16351_c0_seq8:2193-3587(+)
MSVLEGWLEKSPPLNKAGSLLKGFKRRWFVLTSSQLSYYSSTNTKAAAKGTIPLHVVVEVEVNHTWPGSKQAKHPHVFVVKTVDDGGRWYYLSAASEPLMRQWAEAIRATCVKTIMINCSDRDATLIANTHNGLLTIDTRLISEASLAVTVDASISSTTLDILQQAVTKAYTGVAPLDEFVLVMMDRREVDIRVLDATACPLMLQQGEPSGRLLVTQRANAKDILRQLALRAEEARSDQAQQLAFAIRFLGTQDWTGTDLQPTDLLKVYDTLRKRPQGLDSGLTLTVADTAVRVSAETDNSSRGWTVISEVSFVDLVAVHSHKRALLLAVTTSNSNVMKIHAFRCGHADIATHIHYAINTQRTQVSARIERAQARRKAYNGSIKVKQASNPGLDNSTWNAAVMDDDLYLLLTTAGVALREDNWDDLELQLNEQYNRTILRLDTMDALDSSQQDMNLTDAGDVEI